MRILEAIHDFLPDHCAGSEIYTYHLSKALQRRGHEVQLLFTEKRQERPQFEVTEGTYEDLPFHEIVYNRLFHDIADLYHDPRMEEPIGAVLDRVRPDVLHVQSLVYLGLSLIQAAAARGIPVVMTLHEYFVSCPRGGLLLDLDGQLCDPIVSETCARCIAPYPIERERYQDAAGAPGAPDDELRFFARAIEVRTQRMFEGMRGVTRFVAPSRFLAERLIREGLPRERVEVADYGFPDPPTVERRPRREGEGLRFGYLGTLSDFKGVHLAVRAFEGLPPGRATLRVKGEPSWFPDYTGPLEERARSVPGLSFEGALPPGRAAWFLAEIDVLIVPSLWYENSPLTIHEAFQCGVPVVATDLGGMAELVAAGGGVTFRRGDAADLRRRLAELIDEPERIDALVATIPSVKSIDRNAEEMESIFGSLT